MHAASEKHQGSKKHHTIFVSSFRFISSNTALKCSQNALKCAQMRSNARKALDTQSSKLNISKSNKRLKPLKLSNVSNKILKPSPSLLSFPSFPFLSSFLFPPFFLFLPLFLPFLAYRQLKVDWWMLVSGGSERIEFPR